MSISDTDLAFEVHRTDTPTPDAERESLLATPKFGTVFTDHMARVSWTQGVGWHDRRVEKYGPLQLDPATAVLHYAQEIFEGLKAYRHADGSVWTFRPTANAERLQRSARRLALPELPTEDFLASITALVRTDLDWVPSGEETSLYLRPFMYASEAFLGVRPSLQAEYLVIASPVGSYFAGGVKPVSIWVSQDYARAGAGGTGAAKCGGNYAASLLPQQEAYARGCEQVCFLDAATGRGRRLGVHPAAVRVDPRGRHAVLDPHAARRAGPGDPRARHPARRAAGRAPGRVGGRGVRLRHGCGRHPDRPPGRGGLRRDGGLRRRRPGHHGHPPGPDGHPVRPRRRPARVDAPPGLTGSCAVTRVPEGGRG
jgi:hypothetical protein